MRIDDFLSDSFWLQYVASQLQLVAWHHVRLCILPFVHLQARHVQLGWDLIVCVSPTCLYVMEISCVAHDLFLMTVHA